MELINGLLSNVNEFNEFNNEFNNAKIDYPEHSLFIQYLQFRYYDAYDMQNFINNLTLKDEKEKTPVFIRKENELKAYLNRLYGPFYSGRNKDIISKEFLNLSFKEKINYIIKSTNLPNDVFIKLMKELNIDNVYDFYMSLYLQRLENNEIESENIGHALEIDEEYRLWNYSNLRYEQSGIPTISISDTPKEKYAELIEKYRCNEVENQDEPNDLTLILKLTNAKEKNIHVNDYNNRLKGAVLGRFIGCMLGAPVENYSVEKMEEIAKNNNFVFPPIDYWPFVNDEEGLHYKRDKKYHFRKDKLNFVVADDDVTYTVLNALVVDKYGVDFTSVQLMNFWKEHLPYACTAEYATMIGVRKDYSINKIVNNNPYIELIGAAIRADVFGYICPGNPLLAAKLAYKDACISHKRNGIYGEIFLAAAIALSFTTKTCLQAVKLAIEYIPRNCRLKQDLLWALSFEGKLIDYKEANQLITNRFTYMNRVHTNNNMCAIIFAIILGDNDFDKTISNCVAIAYDNDCTAASVGSILGANLSINKINSRWHRCFNNEIHTYIRGYETIKIDKLIEIISKNVNY